MMTTEVEIKVAAPKERARETAAAIERARAAMQKYIDVVNTWDARSDAAKINEQAGKKPVRIDDRLMRLLLHAREVSELSGGAFDVTYPPLARLWNLRAEKFTIPSDETIDRTRPLVNYRNLLLDPEAGTAFLRLEGMAIELGALAKGAAVDAAARSLRESGFANALIRASGDMLALGDKGGQPWLIGIRHPRGARTEVVGAVALRDKAICTSGDYEKAVVVDGKRYHHILDPRTGRPADRTVSVTVIAGNAETADALSTALFVLGPKAGMELCERLPGVEALFIDPEMRILRSSGFPEIQTEE
ncbi:MAG: FAD:protein FMN transferase [Candidatus Sumerlaeia bacterium]|nr:FAD:protein FMN transferase [Candidatus Sumerlaeia bacterium]